MTHQGEELQGIISSCVVQRVRWVLDLGMEDEYLGVQDELQ